MKSRAFPYAFVALVVSGGGVAWVRVQLDPICGNMKVESGENATRAR